MTNLDFALSIRLLQAMDDLHDEQTCESGIEIPAPLGLGRRQHYFGTETDARLRNSENSCIISSNLPQAHDDIGMLRFIIYP